LEFLECVLIFGLLSGALAQMIAILLERDVFCGGTGI
jgi:hypothetical protein